MKRLALLLILSVGFIATPLGAEFREVDIKTFGMD